MLSILPARFPEFIYDSEPTRNWLRDVSRFFEESPYGPLATWSSVLLAAWLANWIAKRVILRAVRVLVGKTKTKWDDALVEHKVFERLSVLAPALVIYLAAPLLFQEGSGLEDWASYVQRFANVWMILGGARAASALLDALASVGLKHESTRDKPVRSYAQVVKLVLWLAVGIIAVATLMQKSPWALLTGLGAMTAILLLVFKDSIVGFVASVRIAANDMVRTGDWIEMSKYGADGDVLEINLHTVKIQNWDKTITLIPTYAFLSDSFKNWRGMTESGGRRIKRSVALDMSSVRFLEEADLERLREIELLSSYLAERGAEVDAWNAERGVSPKSPANGRRLTNLGTFREYLSRY
ncbi:MAG: mechanosensitive ion channel domain-containing protein, partial [Planctomycetota bacterium]